MLWSWMWIDFSSVSAAFWFGRPCDHFFLEMFDQVSGHVGGVVSVISSELGCWDGSGCLRELFGFSLPWPSRLLQASQLAFHFLALHHLPSLSRDHNFSSPLSCWTSHIPGQLIVCRAC